MFLIKMQKITLFSHKLFSYLAINPIKMVNGSARWWTNLQINEVFLKNLQISNIFSYLFIRLNMTIHYCTNKIVWSILTLNRKRSGFFKFMSSATVTIMG